MVAIDSPTVDLLLLVASRRELHDALRADLTDTMTDKGYQDAIGARPEGKMKVNSK
ncbi:MAG: hypothetical protein M0Z95_28185 [Actinomycetota bacterium]|jgi:hypothetical protein|nr:hypothetical protein [Actinomycetota bacterium]